MGKGEAQKPGIGSKVRSQGGVKTSVERLRLSRKNESALRRQLLSPTTAAWQGTRGHLDSAVVCAPKVQKGRGRKGHRSVATGEGPQGAGHTTCVRRHHRAQGAGLLCPTTELKHPTSRVARRRGVGNRKPGDVPSQEEP